jgi:hypothetical protein
MHTLYPTIKTPLRYEDATELQAVRNETSEIARQLEFETMKLLHGGLGDPKSREIQSGMFKQFGAKLNRFSIAALLQN